MMRTTTAFALLLPAALLTAAVPADQQTTAEELDESCRPLVEDPEADPDVDPFVCEEAHFLQCDEAVAGKAHVLAPLASPNASFTTEPPPGSFTEGHGCGEFESSFTVGVTQDNLHDFTFQGPVFGNLDSFAAELHDFYVSPGREAEEVEIGVRVTVNGVSPFGTEMVEVADQEFEVPTMIPVLVEPQVSDTGASVSYRFTIVGLHEILGTASQPGAGEGIEREVKITINTPDDGGHALIWGATEVPSGVTANPLEPAGTVVVATGG